MSTQARQRTLEKLLQRRQEIRRVLTAVEQQIQRTRRQGQIIRQQIVSLSKSPRKAA